MTTYKMVRHEWPLTEVEVEQAQAILTMYTEIKSQQYAIEVPAGEAAVRAEAWVQFRRAVYKSVFARLRLDGTQFSGSAFYFSADGKLLIGWCVEPPIKASVTTSETRTGTAMSFSKGQERQVIAENVRAQAIADHSDPDLAELMALEAQASIRRSYKAPGHLDPEREG